jgi:mRNA interferase HigB
MRIISFRAIREFGEEHPDSKTALNGWYRAVKNADWHSFADVRQTFGNADVYKKCTIFDIGGNKYRLIAWVNYKTHTVYVRHILTHTDYEQDKWKADCGSG